MKDFQDSLKKLFQPERLNPENHIVEPNDMICDSLTSMET